MLIVFSQKFEADLDRLLKEASFRDALSVLALGVKEGKHCVSGPMAVLRSLEGAPSLSKDTQAIFRIMKGRHKEISTLQASVTHVVVLEPRADGDIRQEEVEAKTFYYVPFTFFQDSLRVQKSVLVAENLDDAHVYLSAAEAYVSHAGHKGVTVSLEPLAGGGDQTHVQFASSAGQRLTLGIADSDRRWPEAEPGETARKLKKDALEAKSRAVCGFWVLPCRELENLFPPRLLDEALAGVDVRLRQVSAKVGDLGLLGADGDGAFLDLKEGLCLWEVFRASGPERTHLEKIVGDLLSRVEEPSTGWCDGEACCRKRAECHCVLLTGLGDSVVKKVSAFLEKCSHQKRAEYLLTEKVPGREIWEALGRLGYSWGLGYKRIRV